MAACYKALNDQHVLLERSLVKLNMVTPGSDAFCKASPEEIAKYTVRTLQRTVPPAVPGIVFLSGGQSGEEAMQNLNAINALDTVKPWTLSFSFGHALQATVLKTWSGKEYVDAAQKALHVQAKANFEATLGKYYGTGNQEATATGKESLHVKDYNY